MKVFSPLTEFSHGSSNFLNHLYYRNSFSVSVQSRSFIVTFTLAWVAWKQTPVIRSAAHNLLLPWMEYLLLQMPLVGRKHDFAQLFQVYIRLLPSTWPEKNMCFDWSFSRIVMHIHSFMWIAIQWVCRIDTYCSDKILMHRWIVTPLPTRVSCRVSVVFWMNFPCHNGAVPFSVCNIFLPLLPYAISVLTFYYQ